MADYDFIIVGAGPAGSAVAYKLAHAVGKPSVLLLEAGGENNNIDRRVDGQRYLTFMNEDMNWGYTTVPQEHCNSRELNYSRGRGLGGSSAINFGFYTTGARDDYDEWARLVADDAFSWSQIQLRFKSLETFHSKLPADVSSKYASPNPADHGFSGPLNVGYAAEWEKDVTMTLDIIEGAGLPLNPDHNSGNPIGMAVLVNSAHSGLRSTARDLLENAPSNLTILTESTVQRIIVEENRAVAVDLGEKQYRAAKEIILSAGALDSPRILMHSGIGPAEQLQKFQIPVLHAAPGVGQSLRDHAFCSVVYKRTDTSTDRGAFYGDQAAMDTALEQWRKDGSGPWAKYSCQPGIGFFKLDRLVASTEFQSLPAETKEFLMRETVPHTEIAHHTPAHWFIPDFPQDSLNYACLSAFLYNAQSVGEATLQSADPSVPLRFDPKFLGCEYDRRAAIESLRELLRVTQSSAYAKETVSKIAVPKSDADADLLEYWRQTLSSTWHMTGTVKMGKEGDADAVVDSSFCVKGITGLRVADMSVVPVLPNGHVQAVAYVTGLTCGEKLVGEYELDKQI